MRVDVAQYERALQALSAQGGTKLDVPSKAFVQWMKQRQLPKQLQRLWEHQIFKREVWAGAGCLYPEIGIEKWNNEFPEALQNHFLIVGSAANGDHIVWDLTDGGVGYISHEHDWPAHPRRFYIRVASGLGEYLNGINFQPGTIAEDYWEAKSESGSWNQPLS